jgi:hypothetical protein
MSRNFPVPYTSTAYMLFLASFQCVIIALFFDHSVSSWSLVDAMRLTSSLYAVRTFIKLYFKSESSDLKFRSKYNIYLTSIY